LNTKGKWTLWELSDKLVLDGIEYPVTSFTKNEMHLHYPESSLDEGTFSMEMVLQKK